MNLVFQVSMVGLSQRKVKITEVKMLVHMLSCAIFKMAIRKFFIVHCIYVTQIYVHMVAVFFFCIRLCILARELIVYRKSINAATTNVP